MQLEESGKTEVVVYTSDIKLIYLKINEEIHDKTSVWINVFEMCIVGIQSRDEDRVMTFREDS
jgi:hypothetical protein